MRRDRYRDESLNCRNSEFSGCVSLGTDVTEAIKAFLAHMCATRGLGLGLGLGVLGLGLGLG